MYVTRMEYQRDSMFIIGDGSFVSYINKKRIWGNPELLYKNLFNNGIEFCEDVASSIGLDP